MASYAAVASLVQLLDEISCHDRHQQPDSVLVLGKQELVKSLHGKFSLLQSSLDDYSSKGDEASDSLDRRIRDAAYQAQDIIESHISEEITHGSVGFNQHQWLGYQEDLLKVEEEVDSAMEELMRVKKTKHLPLPTKDDACDSKQCLWTARNSTEVDAGGSERASGDSTAVVGLGQHLTTIKGHLCGGQSKLEIVPIVGMGGIGKTTLARSIFDDKLIAYHFTIRIWVTISQDYSVQDLLLSILDCLDVASSEFYEKDTGKLMEVIYKELKGRRYLIVMDDIWSAEVLEVLKRVSPDDRNGSRVMITTRLMYVADYAGTFGHLHQMQFLDKEQSWNLLREKVFANGRCPHELEDIGMFIANKCRGLPLAIVAIAGVLSQVSRTSYDWEKIAENINSLVIENDEHFSKILSLSYNHLPNHLKVCFLYIGSFPKDYEIPVSRLIRLWIAEGFLKQIGSKSLEDVAEEYLDDLVNRNLVLITKKKSNGRFKLCTIHDLLRDLCARRVQYENFFHVDDENGNFANGREITVRRACFNSNRFRHQRHITAAYVGSHIRSILHFGNYFVFKLSLSGIRLLRVFDALKIMLGYFPHLISKLFHLRYLALCINPLGTKQVKISPSISELVNLQTFIIKPRIACEVSLPSEIWKMPQLRHLIVSNDLTMSLIPSNASTRLGNLQTLSTLLNFRFTDNAIEIIPNLRKLKVRYSDRENSIWLVYGLNNLAHLHQLEELEISSSCVTHWNHRDLILFLKVISYRKI